MVGSDQDEVITPWQSAWYGFFKDGSDKVVETLEQRSNANHAGYKHLYENGKIIFIHSGKTHNQYFDDEDWFKKNIIQYIKD
jgi:regulation of enolase protein 1 (concanavalin A-like superfamily)